TWLRRCRGRKLPSGSHHASACAAKRSTSCGSTVALVARTFDPSRLNGSLNDQITRQEYLLSRCPGKKRVGPSLTDLPHRFEKRMARIVQKFGGTSVADIARIKNVARRVKCEVDGGHEVAVVVSAMAGTTNQLVDWTRDTSRLHDAREYDVVVASGE